MPTVPRPARYLAAAAVTLTLALAGCTGVEDEKGWRKALTRGYPCSELLDIAEDLPTSVDPAMVDEDLRQRGCDPSTLSNR